MRVVGIVAEYNPFHNGHQYHIEQAKKIANADYAVVVMSGNFVQRGAPAIMPKHLRAKAALSCGADLVLELPVCYATGTAEQFAYGAVSLLNKLGCVDAICFGSECGNVDELSELAHILCNESFEYKNELQLNLCLGLSFPAARETALNILYPDKNYGQILSEPNNILGIEYLKALYRLNSNIEPFTIQRAISHYHDENLQEQFSSATAIRNTLASKGFSDLAGQIPSDCISICENFYHKRYPIYANDFSLLLKFKLLGESAESLTTYADVSEELANRIYNHLNDYISFEQFCERLKTKEITYSRISRALIHILLGIKKSDYNEIGYVRVLGFRETTAILLGTIKHSCSLPLVTKLGIDNKMLQQDIYASDLYESVVTDKFQTHFINELQQAIVKL